MNKKTNYYAQHQTLLKEVMIAVQLEFLSEVRLFQDHNGDFLSIRFLTDLRVCRTVEDVFSLVKKASIYRKRIGMKGRPDISGILNIDNFGVRIEIEIKSGKARQTKEQKAWQKMIEVMGGIYVVGRSAEQTIEEIKFRIEEYRKLGNMPEGGGIFLH